MTPDLGIYKRIADVLKADTDIQNFPVNADNILPEDDAVQAKPGALITFSWGDYVFDVSQGKCTGILNMTAQSQESKPKAQELAGLVKSKLTAKVLTGDRSEAVVALFRERAGTTDVGRSESERWIVNMTFDVKAIGVD